MNYLMISPASPLKKQAMTHKEALEEILTLCSENETSIDLVRKIEVLAESALSEPLVTLTVVTGAFSCETCGKPKEGNPTTFSSVCECGLYGTKPFNQ